MNQSPYFKRFLPLFFIISFLYSRILTPQSNDEFAEMLYKNNKAREYHEITRSGLEYNVKGPAEIKIFAKAAFPKKTINESKSFSYNILINDLSTSSNNIKNIDRKVTSTSHPMHVYTYSAKDVIVVPGGDYTIKINKNSTLDPPVLVRLSRSGRKSKDKLKEEFKIPSNLKKYKLKSIKSSLKPVYYGMNYSQPLFIDDVEGLFEFNLRGFHKSSLSKPKLIEAVLLKNGNRNTAYHIWSAPHPSTTIDSDSRVPGRLNKIYLYLNQNNYLFTVKSMNSDKEMGSEMLVKVNRFIK